MGYFTGQTLERKVEEYDLGILDTKFAGIADGSDSTWPPGGYIVPATADVIEATRIVLYSLLHSYRLKSMFTIRARYEEEVIKVDVKAPTRRITGAGIGLGYGSKKRVGGVEIASAGSRPSLQDVPAVPEDLSDVFSEDLMLSRTGEES